MMPSDQKHGDRVARGTAAILRMSCLFFVFAASPASGQLGLVGPPRAQEPQDLPTCENPRGWMLSPAQLAGAVLAHSEWKASRTISGARANLCNAHLYRANLSDADLSDANLSGVILTAADLRNANLEKVELSNADLSLAEMNGAKLWDADLRDADFRAAVLIGAELDRANLNGADLGGANLSDAFLNEANLRNALLDLAILHGASLEEADLTEASLEEANLRGALLWRADLSGATLWDAVLTDSDLQRANLSSAVLEDAKLIRADLRDADITMARFQGADLTNALYILGTTPDKGSISRLTGLESLGFSDEGQAGLELLRKALQDVGLRGPERRITYAIEHCRTGHLLGIGCGRFRSSREPGFPSLSEPGDEVPSLLWRLADWIHNPLPTFEGALRLLAFDLTTSYGLRPGRPLFLILAFIGSLTFVYWVPIARPAAAAALPGAVGPGVYRIAPAGHLISVGPLLFVAPSATPAPLAGIGWTSSRLLAFRLALYFSVLSAFHIGWRDFNVGSWIARLQPTEYVLRPRGWVRVVSGIQSLLSVYLLAIAALTYFGRPFQ